ncbi:MAG: hypothetical protein MJ228_02620 [Bacilli bacterium]|nr:hypothetical protein [Bacilli bacterium]
MIRRTINHLKSDSERRAFFFAFISALICFAYAAYNGVLGILKSSIWNGSICVYYLLLLVIKMLLVVENKREFDEKRRNRVVFFSFFIMLVITLAMITPAILLINNKREYNLGLIPAISMAAYTTYSITMAIINFSKAKTNNNLLLNNIRIINVIAALMSVIVLQNTLILANGGMEEKMQILSACSTFAIIASILIILVIQFIKCSRRNKAV